MTRTVDQVLESIDASIEDVLHDVMTIEDDRGYQVDECMIELAFLIGEYRKLRQTRDLSVLNYRTKEMHVD